MIDIVLGKLLHHLLRRESASDSRGDGAEIASFLRTLPAAARAGGDPGHASFSELSDHVVERLMVPLFVRPALDRAR
jgi:hypothetical protein